MPKLIPLLCFMLLTLPVSGQKKAANRSSRVTTYTLTEAISQKLVAVDVEGTGGHTGQALKVTCRNLQGRLFRLHIPQGQMMEPADSTFQALVVAEEQWLAVGVKVPVSAALRTFCAEAGDRSPLSGASFAVGVLASEPLRRLLAFIAEKGKLDIPEAQYAVWCVANGSPLSGIGDAELTKFTAGLLGKETPAYKVKRRTVQVIPGERAGWGKAMIVETDYRYTLEQDEWLVMNLLDGQGKFIKQVSKEERMKAGEHRGSFHLEVWNLPPGKYMVRMQTKDGRPVKDIEVEF